MAKFTGIELTRDVKCELVLDRAQEDLLDHLNNSSHKAAAKRLQMRQTIHSPGRFKSLNQWISYISTEMKFKDLKVSFDSIMMTLRDANGPTAIGDQVISSVFNEWTIKEINAAFMVQSAKTALFTCILHAGKEPDEIPFTMPLGLAPFLQFDEQNEFGPPNLEQNLSQPQRQSFEVCNDAEPELDKLSQNLQDDLSPMKTPTRSSQVCRNGEPELDTLSQNLENLSLPKTAQLKPKNSQKSISAGGGVTNAQTQQTSEVKATLDAHATTPQIRAHDELGIIKDATGLQSEQKEIDGTELHAMISRLFLGDEIIDSGSLSTHREAYNIGQNKSSTRGASKPSPKAIDPNQISVESLKRIEQMGHGLRVSCKASLDRGGAHRFAHTKASSGLSQVITPRDVWELDQFGPGGTRRDKATFIQEEYDGFDVIDNPAEMIAWVRDVIRDVAPGAPAREQDAGDRSQLYSRYKEHNEGMDGLQQEEIETALKYDREMITESGAGTQNGDFGEVSFGSFVAALQSLTHYYRPWKRCLKKTSRSKRP
jgi:hypothetical protein